VAQFMQESIVFLVRVQCRRKESSRSLSHLLMSFLLFVSETQCKWAPVSMAQWVKPLLIGHSACWADGLMALAGSGSTPGLFCYQCQCN